MNILLTGTLCRAMGDLFYLALLDDRVVCCFVTSEAVELTGTATRHRPLRPRVPTLGSLTSLGQRVIARPSSRRARSFLPMPSARGRWRITLALARQPISPASVSSRFM